MQGRLTHKWKSPTPFHHVLSHAKAVAEKMLTCRAFALNHGFGVVFLNKQAFRKDGNLHKVNILKMAKDMCKKEGCTWKHARHAVRHQRWTVYTKLTEDMVRRKKKFMERHAKKLAQARKKEAKKAKAHAKTLRSMKEKDVKKATKEVTKKAEKEVKFSKKKKKAVKVKKQGVGKRLAKRAVQDARKMLRKGKGDAGARQMVSHIAKL